MYAIEAAGLSKRFGRVPAVDGLDLRVDQGTVFGLLGPNGAGKTTTIRLLVGLLRPDRGVTVVLGQRVKPQDGVPRKVGALVERPASYPYLSGSENLALFGAASGLSGEGLRRRVTELLEDVGLATEAGRRVGGYSAGMRERLAIAQALIGDPLVLVLDEPANALDPEGIAEVRALLSELAGRGVTILLSSHLLTEIERICSEVAIMDRGRIVAAGPLGELTARPARVAIRLPSDREALDARAVLGRADISVGSRDAGPSDVVHVTAKSADSTRIVKTLAAAGIYPLEIRADTPSLEDVYFELTRHDAFDRHIALERSTIGGGR